MKIFDMPQGSVEWLNARLGVVTASEVDAIISPLGKVREGKGVESYLNMKLAEKLVGYIPAQIGTFALEQGTLIEEIALPWFEFSQDKKVKRIGFCLSDDGRCGCSPDGMLEDGSGLEIKSPQPPNQIRYLLSGKVPDDYIMQVHFSMFVTQAPYWTFVSYSIQLPALVIRVNRDPLIQAKIKDALDQFLEEFDRALAKIEAMKAEQ